MYKKIKYGLFASALLICYISLKTMDSATVQAPIVGEHGMVGPQVTTLLKLCSIEHDGTLEDVVRKTQTEQALGGWIRKPGTERWQIEDKEQYKAHTPAIMQCFDQLNMCASIQPHKKKYDYALLLGATVNTVQSRLAYLCELWRSGIRFDELVMLGSDRPLDPSLESIEILTKAPGMGLTIKKDWEMTTVPRTESEMIDMVINRVELPAGFATIKITLINTPNIETSPGVFRRARTGDTIKTWANTNPTPGSVLAISNQPYVGYQNACIQTYIPQSFEAETVGKQAAQEEKLSILFDTLARWLWQEQERRKLTTT